MAYPHVKCCIDFNFCWQITIRTGELTQFVRVRHVWVEICFDRKRLKLKRNTSAKYGSSFNHPRTTNTIWIASALCVRMAIPEDIPDGNTVCKKMHKPVWKASNLLCIGLI